jgi:hypothetical protein
MTTTQAIMLGSLVIGLIATVVGLVLLGRSVYRMYKVVTSLQVELQSQVDLLLSKQDEILVLLDSIQGNQEVLAENLENLQIAYGRLSYIVGELGGSAAKLKPLEPLGLINGRWVEAVSILRRVR